jgi:bifunctional N-acetylglucosamine-1-phosphate-uridyltransferase/glucosamine-1-phosphate-acetyltransferase GlmU-like protein
MLALSETHIVVLAAGQGTRMKSSLPKVLHPIAGRPMIERVLETASALDPSTITLIVGHKAEAIRDRLGKTRIYGLRFRSRSSEQPMRCSKPSPCSPEDRGR